MIDLSKPRKHMMQRQVCSEGELGPSPVSPLSVVPDFVVGSVSDPVGQGAVLLDFFGVACFLSERLDGSHFILLIIHTP